MSEFDPNGNSSVIYKTANFSSGISADDAKYRAQIRDQASEPLIHTRFDLESRDDLDETKRRMERINIGDMDEVLEEHEQDHDQINVPMYHGKPYPVKRQQHFEHKPTMHRADVYSVDEVREMNGRINSGNVGERFASWRDRIDPRSEHYGPYYCKFPGKTHELGDVFFANPIFTFKNGAMTIGDFAKQLQKDGEISMKMSIEQVRQTFPNVSNLDQPTGHIIVKTCKVISEQSCLPIEMTATLTSASTDPSLRKQNRTKQWNRALGASTVSALKNGAVAHVVPRGCERSSAFQQKVWHIANDEVQNSPNFFRYVNTDPAEVYQLIELATMPNQKSTIEFRTAPDDMVKPDNILQFLAIEFARPLIVLSDNHGHAAPVEEVNEHSQQVHRISKDAMLELAKKLFEEIDRNEAWFSLHNLTLTLRPLRVVAGQGIKECEAIANAIEKSPSYCAHPWYFPHFTMELEIAYTPCDHEYKPSSGGGSSSGSLVSSGARKSGSKSLYSMPAK